MKYHHFRDSVKRGTIQVACVEAIEQLADIFTKALTRQPLEYLRGKIMGWAGILLHGRNPSKLHENIQ